MYLTRLQWDIDRVERDHKEIKLTATKGNDGLGRHPVAVFFLMSSQTLTYAGGAEGNYRTLDETPHAVSYGRRIV